MKEKEFSEKDLFTMASIVTYAHPEFDHRETLLYLANIYYNTLPDVFIVIRDNESDRIIAFAVIVPVNENFAEEFKTGKIIFGVRYHEDFPIVEAVDFDASIRLFPRPAIIDGIYVSKNSPAGTENKLIADIKQLLAIKKDLGISFTELIARREEKDDRYFYELLMRHERCLEKGVVIYEATPEEIINKQLD